MAYRMWYKLDGIDPDKAKEYKEFIEMFHQTHPQPCSIEEFGDYFKLCCKWLTYFRRKSGENGSFARFILTEMEAQIEKLQIIVGAPTPKTFYNIFDSVPTTTSDTESSSVADEPDVSLLEYIKSENIIYTHRIVLWLRHTPIRFLNIKRQFQDYFDIDVETQLCIAKPNIIITDREDITINFNEIRNSIKTIWMDVSFADYCFRAFEQEQDLPKNIDDVPDMYKIGDGTFQSAKALWADQMNINNCMFLYVKPRRRGTKREVVFLKLDNAKINHYRKNFQIDLKRPNIIMCDATSIEITNKQKERLDDKNTYIKWVKLEFLDHLIALKNQNKPFPTFGQIPSQYLLWNDGKTDYTEVKVKRRREN